MITAKLTIAQPIRVNASGISTRGARGKSTYELYMETTTDNPPMTEEEFVNSKAVLEQTTGQSITHGMSQKAVTDQLALKVDKVTGKSLISDTEITRLASVTNQTLSGLGGEPAVNKKTTINPASDVEFPTSKAVATALALKTDDATLQASLKAAYPVIPYRSRVLADSGVISDIEKLTKLYVENLKLLDNTVFLWDGSAGIKTRTSGVNTYATKLYDMSAGNRDAAQATEANQPFATGGIAPNEKRRLLGLSNTVFLRFSKISLQDTGWSITFVLNNKTSSTGVVQPLLKAGNAAKGQLRFQDSVIKYVGLDSAVVISLYTPNLTRKGKNEIITVTGINGNLTTFINGQIAGSTTGNTVLELEDLYAANHTHIHHTQIFNKALSASEVQYQHAYLRLQHPEIEGINIGNQHWATSNYEGVVTGDGTVIPEVQESSNISRTGINYSNLILEQGWSNVDGVLYNDGSNNYIRHNGTLPLFKLFKISFTLNVTSGMIQMYNVHWDRTKSVSSSGIYTFYMMTNSTSGYLIRAIGFIGSLENFVFEEVGWNDMTTAYDSLIFEGVAASAAARLISAWCYYNNDPLNGAVYGKEYNLYGAQAINLNAPTGYTIGTYAQWLQMITLLGGTSVAGNKMKLNGTALWAIGNAGTNESGFTALPNGQRNADGTFSQINNKANFWTSDGYLVTLDYNASTVTFTSGTDAKIGAAVRLFRNEPVGGTERTIETGYITNALGVTNLDISIPFGYQVESVRFDSETNITGLSAKLYTGALVELETLFTAKSVTANVQKVISADADQSIEQTDAVVRINGTKADTTKRFRVWIKLRKV